MTTFFSVDVESSGLTPGTGELLTIGIHVVDFKGLHPLLLHDSFYVRIDKAHALRDWMAGNPTFDWWAEQSEEARGEAFADDSLVRHSQLTAARMLVEFVTTLEPLAEQRVFVANPVAFDKMWLTTLFDSTRVADPFHYRSLCLRSMKFGLRRDSRWGSDRETHEPALPHHALSDAHAQALDLVVMLNERDGGAT